MSSSSAALEKPRVGPGSCKAAAALQRQQCAYICAQNHCRCWRDAATWSRRRSGAAANVGQRTCCWAKQPSTLASWRCAQIQSAPRRRGPARWRAQPAGRSEAAGRSDGAARQATTRGQVKTRHNQPPQSGPRDVSAETCLRSHPVRVCAIVDGHRNNTGRLGIINRRNRDGRRKTEKSSSASCARVCDRRWTP